MGLIGASLVTGLKLCTSIGAAYPVFGVSKLLSVQQAWEVEEFRDGEDGLIFFDGGTFSRGPHSLVDSDLPTLSDTAEVCIWLNPYLRSKSFACAVANRIFCREASFPMYLQSRS